MSTAGGELKATLSLQRKAAIVQGGASDHAGQVHVDRMTDFDMGRTIFGGLTGIARKFMFEKLVREPVWDESKAAEIEAAYAASESARPAPTIDQRLIDFMIEECDFSMEHADGTFLEHLVFCHDYAAHHYPEHSPNVALLHSILGTATNTFAMDAAKIPCFPDSASPGRSSISACGISDERVGIESGEPTRQQSRSNLNQCAPRVK